MRQLGLTIALVMMAAVPVACGSDDEGGTSGAQAGAAGSGVDAGVGGADAGTGGTDGGSGGQSNAGAAGDSAGPPPCEEIESLDTDSLCLHQVVLPTTGADGGLSFPSCTISLESEDFDPTLVNIALDCELSPQCVSDYDVTDECWQYDDANLPTAIVQSEALCARITEEGFTRIDIVALCGGPII